jgi:A/G-specific adenine glycosylase
VNAQVYFFRDSLMKWAEGNLREFPWRETTDPYKVCVAEIMLHQTFAWKVAPVYGAFIQRYPDVVALSRAQLPTLTKMLYPLGLNYRARILKEMAKAVVKNHGGAFPTDKKGLLSLPGVGEYTASAILCFAYGEQVPIIDANVVRVYARFLGLGLRLPRSSPNKEILRAAAKALPKGRAREFNYAILDFASVVCSHYNPKHANCPVVAKCMYFGGKRGPDGKAL